MKTCEVRWLVAYFVIIKAWLYNYLLKVKDTASGHVLCYLIQKIMYFNNFEMKNNKFQLVMNFTNRIKYIM